MKTKRAKDIRDGILSAREDVAGILAGYLQKVEYKGFVGTRDWVWVAAYMVEVQKIHPTLPGFHVVLEGTYTNHKVVLEAL